MFIIPVKYSSTARDGQASTSLTSKRRRKKRTLHLVQSHSLWCACGCVSVCASVCVSVCVSYLWVHLRHWAAGYAALKGCVSAAISPPRLSRFLTPSLILCTSVLFLSVWFAIPVHLYSIICTLSSLISKDRAKCWRSVSFTAFHIQHRQRPYAIGEGSWLAPAVFLWT